MRTNPKYPSLQRNVEIERCPISPRTFGLTCIVRDVCVPNLNPDVMVMKSAEDRT